MANAVVIGLGEVLWDCFPDARRPGGAPANVAYHAGQLGCQALVCSRVGNDEDGRELLTLLAARGLVVDFIQQDAEHRTGTVTVDTSRPDHPQFTIHEDVAWDHLQYTPAWEQLTQQASAICFGSLAQRSPTSRQTIHHMLADARENCLLVFDVNLRQQYYDKDIIASSLQAAGCLKLNDAEVAVLAEMFDVPAKHAEFAPRLAERFGLDAVCITRGGDGCLLYADGETIDEAGRPVEVVDAVGAGDAFTAAWIHTRLAGRSPREQAAFANRVGGLVASHAGAMPELEDQYRALIEETFGPELSM